jgi:tetratricopeptide (TPR) repeat protein
MAGSRTDRSIIPTMLRLAPAGGWFLASLLLACGGPPPPTPSKLSESAENTKQATAEKAALPSPFTNPNKEPPPPRSEPQLPADQLAAALERAEAARKIGDALEASIALRACANKVPQSVRCEGELAALLAKMPRHKYEAEYYLKQAIAGDAPDLDADYYRRLGEALVHRGHYPDAVTAYQRMIERSKAPSATDYNLLATTLQGVPSRLAEASDALRKAYELDPTRHEWLRDEAILLGQQQDKIAQAIARFEEFKGKTTDPALLKDTDQRIAELKTILDAMNAPPPAPAKGAKKKKEKKPAP